MKIAATATEASLDSMLDPRFGRCPYFLVIDTDSLEFEAIDNDNNSLGGGAGIQSAKLLAEKQAKVVLTGNCGPNAHQTLTAAGIDVIIGVNGVIRDLVKRFNLGELQPSNAPNVSRHAGMNDQ